MVKMKGRARFHLQRKIAQHFGLSNVPVSQHLSLKFDKTNNAFSYELPLRTRNYDIRSKADLLAGQKINETFQKINHVKRKNNHEILAIDVNRDTFVKTILEDNLNEVKPPEVEEIKKKVIVEFSSPNIAKPFHVGHLRSTIIGNYISNLHSYLHNDVIRLNYLGDWGTQLGFVMLGMDLLDIPEDRLRENPIKELYEVYVHANKLAETDSSILQKAKEIFQKLENGDPTGLQRWESFKNFTIPELEKTYKRIGVTFNEYNWESSYNFSKIQEIISQMEKLQLLKLDKEGRKVVEINEARSLPIIKSDGSTLYITRDIAAAIDRASKYDFDAMYYVVDSSQHDHLNNLFTILNKMALPWANKLHHVKFGKIKGMSTRMGTAVFLKDILDEAASTMKAQQRQTATTKVSLDDEKTSEILGMSAVIVHDLKQRRTRDYVFSWDVALDIKGETGVKLQYTHCRLWGIEENSGATLPHECDSSLLTEPIVNDLVAVISQFDEAVVSSYQTLESCHLAKYLFNLSHTVNKTIKDVRVKGESSDVASQRLLLYRAARNVLCTGMKLLGLVPLNRM